MKLIDITGKAISGEWGNDCEDGNGIPVLRTTNFTDTGVINFANVVLRDIPTKDLSKKFLRPGDIIIEKSGGSDTKPVGRVVYFDSEENKYLINNFTGLLRVVDQTKWYPRYVFYALFANYSFGGTRQYENKTTGLHNLKLDQYLNSFDIPDVDFQLQHHIADTLDKVSEGIEVCRRMLGELDLMVKAKFGEMFGNPTGNSFNLSVKPMTEVCEIIDGDRGKNYPNADEFSDEGYCLFLNAKNVTASGFNFDNCMYITKEKDDILRKGKLSRGDVVLTTRGTIGNLAFYTSDIPYEHMRINSGMVILRMNRKIINEVFFIEQFKMLLDGIKQKIASGSAQPQLPISAMREINLLLPDIEQQKIFSEFVAKSNKSRLTLQQVLSKMELERKVLMQKYFG